MTARGPACAALVLALAAPVSGAQNNRRVEPGVAEVAISLGRLDDAETELYAASARSPHEPSARGALGSFLAARGRLEAGAVLLEEARGFGGDAREIDARLAHIYRWSGDWALAAALAQAPFGRAERERARWLASHPESTLGPDSSVVPLAPAGVAGLGRIRISIGGDSLDADIDPSVEGLMLPATSGARAGTQLFGAQDVGTLAVVATVGIGEFALANVPARLERGARTSIGLDLLGRLTPTFDMAARRLILRAKAGAGNGRSQMPLLLTFPGVKIGVRPRQPLVALDGSEARAVLRAARWTLDLRRGAVVIER